MRILEGTEGIENPSFLAVNSAGSVLYAVSEKDQGEVYAYAIDPAPKRCNHLEVVLRKAALLVMSPLVLRKITYSSPITREAMLMLFL